MLASSPKLVRSAFSDVISVFTFSRLTEFDVLKSGKCFTLNTASACIAVATEITDSKNTLVNEIPRIVFEFIRITVVFKIFKILLPRMEMMQNFCYCVFLRNESRTN